MLGRLMVAVTVCAFSGACASHAPILPQPSEPRSIAANDSIRGRQLATLIIVGDTNPGVSVAPRMGAPNYRRTENGRSSAIVAFVVEASGRVSQSSRTVVLQSGEADFAKAACKWLESATFVFKTRAPGPTFVLMPFIVFTPGDFKPPSFRELLQGLWEMSPSDREQWLSTKPACTEL